MTRTPSVWPFVLGGGIALLALGVVTNYVLTGLGVLLIAGAVAGWVGDLLHG